MKLVKILKNSITCWKIFEKITILSKKYNSIKKIQKIQKIQFYPKNTKNTILSKNKNPTKDFFINNHLILYKKYVLYFVINEFDSFYYA